MSIITVCRNSEETIARTIQSVLDQTYPAIEYIIIDGGSTDRTPEIIRAYQPRFKGRLRWVSERDQGIYDAMNKGIDLAHGTLIGMINSDDWYEPQAVDIVVKAFRHHGEGVYYGILRVMENEKEYMLRLVNHQFLHTDVVGHPAFFVASAIYRKHGRFRLDYRYASDFELMMRLLRLRVPFIRIERVLSNFTHGGETTKHALKTMEEYLRIRHEYGYSTRISMLFRILRNRISTILEAVNRNI